MWFWHNQYENYILVVVYIKDDEHLSSSELYKKIEGKEKKNQ